LAKKFSDVPMFDVSGLAIAIGQAPDDVKSREMVVTENNETEGWALAINN